MMRLLFLAALFFPTLALATAQTGSVNGAAGNISGTMTATQFAGGGAGLTGVPMDPGIATSTAALAAKFITNSSSMTNTSVNGILVASSVTAGSFFGDGRHLSNVAATFAGGTVAGQTSFVSTLTVLGNAFSVGGSTFVVAGGNVGIGGTASLST